MINLKRRQALPKALVSKQRGGALILIAFMIGIALTAFVINNFNTSSIKAEQDAKTMEALGQAKEALVAWSVAHPNWPGVMPFPDRETDVGGYDGVSDCVTSGVTSTHLLGMLPFLSGNPCFAPQTELGVVARDGSGERLWYAVSRNLVRTNGTASTPVINPGIINNPPTAPWMTVRDSAGVVLSDRVAAVIIASGPALSGQDRSGNNASPSNFLDQVTVGVTNYSNADYDEVFIIGETTSGSFNDRLIYITIDELIYAVEKRAANEISKALIDFRDANGEFPFAASLGEESDHFCRQNTKTGLLPLPKAPLVHSPNLQLRECNVNGSNSSISCSNGYTDIKSISYQKSSSGSMIFASGDCSYSGTRCTCTGFGRCLALEFSPFAIVEFSCDTNANCSADRDGSFEVISASGKEFTGSDNEEDCPIDPDGSQFSCAAGSSASGTRLACDDPAFADYLPAWISANDWQDYFYYSTSRDGPALIAGTQNDVEALLIGMGAPLIAPAVAASKLSDQVRPSSNLNDYMDSDVNTDDDEIFDDRNSRRNTNYNDRTYIVAP